MSSQVCKEFEIDALRSGQFAVINATTVETTVRPTPLKSYLQRITEACAVLEQTTRRPRHAMIVVESSGSLTLTTVVPATAQGGLFGTSDTSEVQVSTEVAFNDSPPGCSETEILGASHGSSVDGPLERSSLAEAELIAQEARRASIAAIHVGTSLAKRAEKEILSAEELPSALSSSPSQEISRATYALARGSERTVNFLAERLVVGGWRQIPSDALSSQVFSLRGCRVVTSPDSGRLGIRGRSDDPGWGELMRAYPDSSILQTKDANSALDLLRLAQALDLPIDLDVCVAEKVRTGKRHLAPLRVRNLPAFLSALRERLDLLEELNGDAETGMDSTAEPEISTIMGAQVEPAIAHRAEGS